MFVFFLLAVSALLFVLAPVWWSRGQARSASVEPKSAARDEAALHSRAWYDQRMQELAEEDLDEAQRAELSDELASVLLAEYPSVETAADDQNLRAQAVTPSAFFARPANLLLITGALLVALAVGVYGQLGSFGASKIQGAQEVLALSPESDLDALQRWQDILSEWLIEEPEDAQSWYLLGHAHLKQGAFSSAENAFAEAHEYANSDVSVKFYWLQARYLDRQGVLDDRSRQLAQEILAIDPNSPQVLEMLAVAAISDGDAGEAISLLNRTLNSEQRPERVRATVDAIGALRSAYVQQEGKTGIQVNVRAARETDPKAVVFVLARPIGGGMPYAVVRRPSWLLPFSVNLDDLVSMSPDRPLSQAGDFEVLVRLSASGLAQAEAGDWRWLSEPLTQAGAADGQKVLNAILAPAN